MGGDRKQSSPPAPPEGVGGGGREGVNTAISAHMIPTQELTIDSGGGGGV